MSQDGLVGHTRLRRQFPAVRLLDVAAISVAPASVFIATMGYLGLTVMEWVIRRVFAVNPAPLASPMDEQLAVQSVLIPGNLSPAMTAILYPWWSTIQPIVTFVTAAGDNRRFLTAAVEFLVGVIFWSLIGTILCRRSATLFAGNDESSMQRAIAYSVRRWKSAVIAPAIPLFSAVLLGVIAAVVGLLGCLPFLGHVWLVMTSPLTLILAFAMAFLLLATAFGWPLMLASIAVDDCDGFGALSRAFSSLSGRPWHAFGFAAISLLTGAIAVRLVNLLGTTTYACAVSSVAVGSGLERFQQSLLIPLTSAVSTVIAGFGISYFWSAVTVIALLLRQEIDGVPLDRLSLDDALRPAHDPFPVVGIPATDARPENNGHV
jgi:hypothetical protein